MLALVLIDSILPGNIGLEDVDGLALDELPKAVPRVLVLTRRQECRAGGNGLFHLQHSEVHWIEVYYKRKLFGPAEHFENLGLLYLLSPARSHRSRRGVGTPRST